MIPAFWHSGAWGDACTVVEAAFLAGVFILLWRAA